MVIGTTEGYQLHSEGTDKYGAFCFEENTGYFIAVTRNLADMKLSSCTQV